MGFSEKIIWTRAGGVCVLSPLLYIGFDDRNQILPIFLSFVSLEQSLNNICSCSVAPAEPGSQIPSLQTRR